MKASRARRHLRRTNCAAPRRFVELAASQRSILDRKLGSVAVTAGRDGKWPGPSLHQERLGERTKFWFLTSGDRQRIEPPCRLLQWLDRCQCNRFKPRPVRRKRGTHLDDCQQALRISRSSSICPALGRFRILRVSLPPGSAARDSGSQREGVQLFRQSGSSLPEGSREI